MLFCLCYVPGLCIKLLKFQRSRLCCRIFIHIFQLYYTRYLYSHDCNQFYILTNVNCKIRNSVLRLQSIYTINDLSIYLSIYLSLNKLPQLKYIHFALDEKQLNDRKVLLGNGNHWTCFVSSTTLDELYYGDSLGWKLRANLVLVMKPIFSVLMHPLLPSNSQHMCSSHWFQAFPQQNCVRIIITIHGGSCGNMRIQRKLLML